MASEGHSSTTAATRPVASKGHPVHYYKNNQSRCPKDTPPLQHTQPWCAHLLVWSPQIETKRRSRRTHESKKGRKGEEKWNDRKKKRKKERKKERHQRRRKHKRKNRGERNKEEEERTTQKKKKKKDRRRSRKKQTGNNAEVYRRNIAIDQTLKRI